MKISNTPPSGRTGSLTSTAGQSRTTSSAKQSTVRTGSSSTADQASRLNELESQFSKSEFDASKVAAVSAAIADGRYQVNAGAVADKLLASASELLGKKA